MVDRTLVAGMIQSIADGLVLAEKTDLGTENLYKFIEAQFPGVHPQFAKRMMDGQSKASSIQRIVS